MQSGSTTNAWLKFLNPVTLRENLIRASLYLAAFEMLENSVIDRLRGFFCFEYDENHKLVDSDDYKTEVLSRHKSRFGASLNWLIENSAIDASDEERAQKIRAHRNLIGHQLPQIIASSEHELDPELFDEILKLVAKIDRYWIRELEIPSNSEFDHLDPYEIPDAEILSGNMIFLGLMRDIAIGESGDEMYNAALEALKKSGRPPQNAGQW